LDRSLSAPEKALIAALLSHLPKGADRYNAQLEHARVVDHCSCGCPSIDLALGKGRKRPVGDTEILVGGDGRSPEGTPVGIILWVRGGELSGLEVHAWDAATDFTLPAPDTLDNVSVGDAGGA
jgi:hypothetical protein